MGQWVHARLSRLDPGRRQKMWSLYIAGEYGGMNETLARLAAVSGQEQFLTTATYFDQENLLEAGRTGTDILDDMHANQHVPQLIGYVHEYELTGEQRYLEARSEEHTSELQSRGHLVCRLLLEKKNTYDCRYIYDQ